MRSLQPDALFVIAIYIQTRAIQNLKTSTAGEPHPPPPKKNVNHHAKKNNIEVSLMAAFQIGSDPPLGSFLMQFPRNVAHKQAEVMKLTSILVKAHVSLVFVRDNSF